MINYLPGKKILVYKLDVLQYKKINIDLFKQSNFDLAVAAQAARQPGVLATQQQQDQSLIQSFQG